MKIHFIELIQNEKTIQKDAIYVFLIGQIETLNIICFEITDYQTLHFSFGFILLEPSFGQDHARENFSLFDNGPITRNLSGACSSLITWLRMSASVWTAHHGNAYPR